MAITNNSKRDLTNDELVDLVWVSEALGIDTSAARRVLGGPGGPPRVELNTRVHRWWKSDINEFLLSRTMTPGTFLASSQRSGAGRMRTPRKPYYLDRGRQNV